MKVMAVKVASKVIFIAAGEVSGDIHAADLMLAMKKIDPGLKFIGMGGRKMEAAGLKSITGDVSFYSTVGFIDFIRFLFIKVFLLLKAVRFIKANRDKIQSVILVDDQGFNIPLAGSAKKLGLRTIYYFPPHVSIWVGKSLSRIIEIIDYLVVPHKADYEMYLKYKKNTFFCGNPLLDKVGAFKLEKDFYKKHNLDKNKKTVSILPGSRFQEVESLLPIMLDAADILMKEHDIQIILPISHPVFKDFIITHIKNKNLTGKIKIAESSYEAMCAADVNILASGTASLESVMFHKPPVICYQVLALTYWIGKKLVKGGMIGIPNIILKKMAFPELLQKDCNPERIVRETLRFLHLSQSEKKQYEDYYAIIKKDLGKPPVLANTAKYILDKVKNG
jgi:lipid-A-disaccharide synthase